MILPKLYLILLSTKAEQAEIVSDLLWKKVLLPTLSYKDFPLWGDLTYPERGTSIKEVRCQSRTGYRFGYGFHSEPRQLSRFE